MKERHCRAPRGEGHRDHVVLPNGTSIWGCSFPEDGYSLDDRPDFGLYLDPRWQPPWRYHHLDWPDFGLPTDGATFGAALEDVLARSRRGQTVQVGCLAGHGRTGTALACLAIMTGLADDPVEWVRDLYCPWAVETSEQEAFARSFRRSPDQ